MSTFDDRVLASRKESLNRQAAGSVTAHRRARERASVAVSLEASLLHTAIYDLRELGLSVRQAARELQVPKSTVARHWRKSHSCPEVLPMWGSESAYRDAHAAIWEGNPEELADDWVPYEWSDVIEDGVVTGRRVTRVTQGVAVLAPGELGGRE